MLRNNELHKLSLEELYQIFRNENWQKFLYSNTPIPIETKVQKLFDALAEKEYGDTKVKFIISPQKRYTEKREEIEGEYNHKKQTVYINGITEYSGIMAFATYTHEMCHRQQYKDIDKFRHHKTTTVPNIKHMTVAKMFYDTEIDTPLYASNYMEINANKSALYALSILQRFYGFRTEPALSDEVKKYNGRVKDGAKERKINASYQNYLTILEMRTHFPPPRIPDIRPYSFTIEKQLYEYAKANEEKMKNNIYKEQEESKEIYNTVIQFCTALSAGEIPINLVNQQLQSQCYTIPVYSTERSQQIHTLLNQHDFPYIPDAQNNKVYIPKDIPEELKQQIDCIIRDSILEQPNETLDELIARQVVEIEDAAIDYRIKDEGER